MGQALGKGSELMPGPSKLAETIVGFFLPAERREEVLGDLYERYRSPGQYAWDAVRTVPYVILSGLLRKNEETMNIKVVVTVVIAFLSGLMLGVVLHTPNNLPATFFPNAIPFLVLLTLWAVLLIFKFGRRKPKC